jgi:hypothetical protein
MLDILADLKRIRFVLLFFASIFVIGLVFIGYSKALDPKTAFVIYTFEDGNGEKVKDLSGNGNDADFKGNNIQWVKGKNGGGLKLGGANNSLVCPTINGVGKTFFSECLWANFDDLTPENQFGYISCTQTANARYFYFSTWSSAGAPNDAIHCGTLDAAGAWGRGISTGRVFKKGQWYHVAGVIDTKVGTIRVYVDGSLVQEMVITPGDTPGTPAEIWVGGSPEAYQWLTGTIDDVGFFNVALTEDDINNIMNNGLAKGFAVQAQGKLPITWATIKNQ